MGDKEEKADIKVAIVCANPSCQNDGKNKCAGCKLETLRYCGKDCQTAHWSSHKGSCKGLKAAKILMNPENSISERVEQLSTGVLLKDNGWDAAVSISGFLECLVSLIREDIALYEKRVKSGIYVSYTQHIFCGLFPGFQSEQREDQFFGLNKYRFLSFLDVDGAWEAILDAATVLLRANLQYPSGRQFIRDLLKGMSDAFASKAIACVILTRYHKVTAIRLRGLWICIRDQDQNGKDPHSALEGLVNQQISILEYWSKTLKLEKDSEGVTFIDRVGIKKGSSNKEKEWARMYEYARSFALDEIKRINAYDEA